MGIRHNEEMIVNGRLSQAGVSFRNDLKNHRVAVFACSCGNRKIIDVCNVQHGRSLSCGCLTRESAKTHRDGHSAKTSPAFRSWNAMWKRCTAKPGSHHWLYYGGKGIVVCDRWKSFQVFLDDIGERPDGHTLDRIDGAKGYLPENCRWATKAVQCVNVSDIRMITYDDQTMCLKDWARKIGINYLTLWNRLKDGWSVEKAFTAPIRKWPNDK